MNTTTTKTVYAIYSVVEHDEELYFTGFQGVENKPTWVNPYGMIGPDSVELYDSEDDAKEDLALILQSDEKDGVSYPTMVKAVRLVTVTTEYVDFGGGDE